VTQYYFLTLLLLFWTLLAPSILCFEIGGS
jgi:hypothetical protein